MSASDQEEVTETPDPEAEPRPGAKTESEPKGATAAGESESGRTAPDADAADDDADVTDPGFPAEPDPAEPDPADPDDDALTPRQARRIRVAVASVLLVAMAALLAVRLANRSSVLVVGVYGLAMILCGVVIELSRHGRTRLATWVLGLGLAATLATDWLLLP